MIPSSLSRIQEVERNMAAKISERVVKIRRCARIEVDGGGPT
jgi:hypothetical protein